MEYSNSLSTSRKKLKKKNCTFQPICPHEVTQWPDKKRRHRTINLASTYIHNFVYVIFHSFSFLGSISDTGKSGVFGIFANWYFEYLLSEIISWVLTTCFDLELAENILKITLYCQNLYWFGSLKSIFVCSKMFSLFPFWKPWFRTLYLRSLQ